MNEKLSDDVDLEARSSNVHSSAESLFPEEVAPHGNETEKEQETRVELKTADINISKPESRPSEDTVVCNDEYGAYGVFDGMGGYKGGREASQLAAQVFENTEFPDNLDPADPEHNRLFLEDVLTFANNEISQWQQAESELSEMGTTATVLRRFKDKQGKEMAAYASVGDTRLLRIRDGKVEFLTYEEFDDDQPSKLTNVLGGRGGFAGVDRKFNIGVVDLEPGDRLVLLSDGISGDWLDERLKQEDYESILNPHNNPTPEQTAEALSAIAKSMMISRL